MADPFSFEDLAPGDIEAALRSLERWRRTLRELRDAVAGATTTVRSPDGMVSATFDGCGELLALHFHGTAYRVLPPDDLASTLVEVLSEGRTEALRGMAELTGSPMFPWSAVLGLFGRLPDGIERASPTDDPDES
jgi:hypothetical protein